MRRTKAMIEEELMDLRRAYRELASEKRQLERENEFLKKFSASGMTSSIAISAERISTAATQLVTELNKSRR